MKATAIVIDNFLRHPEILNKESQKLKYVRSSLNPSNFLSAHSKSRSFLHNKMLQQVGRHIDWDKDSATYRKTTSDEVKKTKNEFFCHCDGITNVVGLLYLSQPSDCHGGTGFYRHKESGLEGVHDEKAVVKFLEKSRMSWEAFNEMLEADSRVPSKWTQTDTFQMKYNRLIIYNGRVFHSHIFDFKKVKKGAVRLSMPLYGTLTSKVFRVSKKS